MNRITDKKHLILAALLLFLGFVATSVARTFDRETTPTVT